MNDSNFWKLRLDEFLVKDVNLVLFTLGFPCCVFQLSYEGFDLLMQEEKKSQVQVNLCQKLIFLHQLNHNMTTDCSLNYKFNTWKFQAQTWGEHIVYRTIFVHNMFSPCSAKRKASDKDLSVQEIYFCFQQEAIEGEKFKNNFWSTKSK